jgi:hypothetical protein
VRWYGLMYLVGFTASWWLGVRPLRAQRFTDAVLGGTGSGPWREVLHVPLRVRREPDAAREGDPLTSLRLQLRYRVD